MSDNASIIILGAGPAGGAVALGLKRMGYAVTVVTSPRPFKAIEGVSERVIEGLTNAGFELQDLPAPSVRHAAWNGEVNQANQERLLNRHTLDQQIVATLKKAQVQVIEGRVVKTASDTHGHQVWVEDEQSPPITADFLVEARGRSAPASGMERLRGIETVSVLQYWQGPPCAAHSAAESFEQGWGWFAAEADGTRYLQLTFDVASAQLPKKAQLVEHCTHLLQQMPSAQAFMAYATPTGHVHARISTPILCEQPVGDNWIRVGDAAMAVDPLSGNGIFQALSSALQAPAVINTLIKMPASAALAQRFYQQRVEHLFMRFARIGRDFYAMETRWPAQPFWSKRRSWPDAEPIHQYAERFEVTAQSMPVVVDQLIAVRDVVVTIDQPLGIWHLNGVELAPFVKALQQRSTQQSAEQCLIEAGLNVAAARALLNWMAQQRWAI